MDFDEETYEMIEMYLNESLSDADRDAFEVRIRSNADLAEEVNIHREMRLHYGGFMSSVSYQRSAYDSDRLKDLTDQLRSEEAHELAQKIRAGKARYDRKRKARVMYVYYAAASVALLLLINFLWIQRAATPQALYAEYKDWESLPSLTVKGGNEADLAKGEAFFMEGNYEEVITLFRKRREENNPHILLYLGASYLEMNDFQQAQAVFEQLLAGDTLDSHKAYWYLALVYLKQGSVEKAEEQLLLVRQNPANYRYEQAKALLEELDR